MAMSADAIFGAVGRFSVRYRWLMAVAWLAAAIAAVALLPPLSSVTQSDNTKFLPASAPTERAVRLAAPFGVAGLLQIPVLAARPASPLTRADSAALTRLQHRLAAVPGVVRTIDVGRSPDVQAEQLTVLARQLGGDVSLETALVDRLRNAIRASAAPAGLQVHLTGALATIVDQQKANGNRGSELQNASALFIVLLLVVIFRSLTLALVTLIPAFMSALISGPLVAEAAHHGLRVSPLAQFLMIVLVLGAGTDYGLFLVFRVREQLRGAGYDGGPLRRPAHTRAARGLPAALRAVGADLAKPREAARDAVVTSVTRVGESVTFSGATVIAAVLTLLLASFPFYGDLGVPFAIAIGVTLAAALTLLPALLSIRLSVLGAKRTVFQAAFGRAKLIPWSIQGAERPGMWGKISARIVSHPAATLAAGVVFFGGLSIGVLGYAAAGFGGNTTPPSGSDAAAGAALLARHFPQAASNPTEVFLKFRSPVLAEPAVLARATTLLQNSIQFNRINGPLNPVGGPTLTPDQYLKLSHRLGPAKDLQPVQPAGTGVPSIGYQLYRASGNYFSRDGRTVLFSTALSAGDPGTTAAMNTVPGVRQQVTRIAAAVGATDSGVTGLAPAFYDISSISNRDLRRIVPVAIVAIGLLLAIVLRSLVAPLYLIASVAISYLAALGLAVLLFVKIGGSTGLVFFLPFLMFIFLLALGEDYNILVMTRIREEAHRMPLRPAVARALTVTGSTVSSAGLVLAGTFIVLSLVAGRGSGNSSYSNIGLGLAFGILMDTFLVRTLLVPSMVVLLGRWNWWPSRLTIDRPEPATEPAVAASVLPEPGRAG
jgi:putative drug exporter of the RND superfamily